MLCTNYNFLKNSLFLNGFLNAFKKHHYIIVITLHCSDNILNYQFKLRKLEIRQLFLNLK